MGKPNHRWAKLGDACGLSDAMDNILLDQLEYLAVMDDDRVQKRFLKDLIREYVRLEKRVKALLKNTLPAAVADEIQFEAFFALKHWPIHLSAIIIVVTQVLTAILNTINSLIWWGYINKTS